VVVSLGPSSNFTAAHLWNLMGERSKQEGNQIGAGLWFETPSSKNYYPRAVLVDFKEAFGNYGSVFGL